MVISSTSNRRKPVKLSAWLKKTHIKLEVVLTRNDLLIALREMTLGDPEFNAEEWAPNDATTLENIAKFLRKELRIPSPSSHSSIANTRPTKEGYYWYCKRAHPPIMVRVCRYAPGTTNQKLAGKLYFTHSGCAGSQDYLVSDVSGRWSEFIPEPAE